MIELGGNGDTRRVMVESTAELPVFGKVKRLYRDVETTSFDPDMEAFRPFHGHKVAGIAVTVDDHKTAYYIPIRHTGSIYNLDPDVVARWSQDTVDNAESWVNHNICFDAHFDYEGDGVDFKDTELVDTTVLSKIIDNDRFRHGLKPLCKEMFGAEDWDAPIGDWLRSEKSKNYGDAPADLMAPYACDDVIWNRRLYEDLIAELPTQCSRIWSTERKLTPVLYDMEKLGLQVDKRELAIQLALCLHRILEAQDRIKDFSGTTFIDSNKEMKTLLLGQMGLPILMWNYSKLTGERTNPSFDAEAFDLYLGHPIVQMNPEYREVLEAVQEFRKESHFKSLFLESWLKWADESSIVHFQYNQLVRTGRMSGHDPSAQQLNGRAKRLIHPRKGRSFLSADASQIEFRLIAMYCKIASVIDAYARDPRTDFHDHVTKMCEYEDRKAGKTMNFAMAYGAGERKVTRELASNPAIMEAVRTIVEEKVESGEIPRSTAPQVYEAICQKKATGVYRRYHEELPEIKKIYRRAQKIAESRGFVFSRYGRRRHLDSRGARKAFNSIIQGHAMDFIKERMVFLSPRYNSFIREHEIDLAANVHDECLFEGPTEVMNDPVVQQYINDNLEMSEIEHTVPIVWDLGTSETNWKEAVA